MTRWWSSPDQGAAVLSAVDDSDVVQGVGTALLGYHALSQKALQPLTQTTLVDVAKVYTALDDIDLEPVAKALGEATKPVLGDASAKYGELLAQDIHKQARDATERLLLSWTQTGMPWPHAIERAAEVHGVPINRLGRYANVMKGMVSPLVRQDIADRALMEYASELGYREGGSAQGVSKAGQNQEDPDFEQDHPRGAGGRFRSKGAVPPREAREARRERRLRRDKRAKAKAADRVQELNTNHDAVRAQVNALMNVFLGGQTQKVEREKVDIRPKADKQKMDVRQTAAKPKGQLRLVKKPKQEKAVVAVPPAPSRPAGVREQNPVQRQRGIHFMLFNRNSIPSVGADQLLRPADFGISVYSERDLARAMKGVNPEDIMLVQVQDPEVVDTGEDNRGGMRLSRNMAYDPRRSTTYQKEMEFGPEWNPVAVTFDVLFLHEDEPDLFSKGLDAHEVAEFNQEHPRGGDGRFRNAGGNPTSGRQQRVARRQRRQLRRRAAAEEAKRAQVNPVEAFEALRALNAEFNRPKDERQKVNVRQKADRNKADIRPKARRNIFDEEKANTASALKDVAVEQETPAKAGQIRDIVEASRLANARANDFLNQRVAMLTEDDFALAHGAYLQDFLNGEMTNMGWRFNDGGVKETKLPLAMVLSQIQRDPKAEIEALNPYNKLSTSEEVALEEAEIAVRLMRQTNLTSDYQADAQLIELENGQMVFKPTVYNYDRTDKRVILIFDSEKARKQYYAGDLVAFDTMATESLDELFEHYDIDRSAADIPISALNPNVAAFHVRMPSADEASQAKRDFERGWYEE